MSETVKHYMMLEVAREAAERAYAPYSNFQVGAAVYVPETREIVPGCNIENASYGLTICAERTAIFTAVSRGARNLGPIAVTCLQGDPEHNPASVMPCGGCRQVMSEFMDPDELVIIDHVGEYALKKLLPMAFHL